MSDDVVVIYGITKGGNLFTNKGIVDRNFNHVDEKIEYKPVKPVFFPRHPIRENYDHIITCTSRRSFRKVQKFLREHKEPHREIIKEHKVDFHITENQWKEIQELKIANIKKLK
jgi:hypothetical protein